MRPRPLGVFSTVLGVAGLFSNLEIILPREVVAADAGSEGCCTAIRLVILSVCALVGLVRTGISLFGSRTLVAVSVDLSRELPLRFVLERSLAVISGDILEQIVLDTLPAEVKIYYYITS